MLELLLERDLNSTEAHNRRMIADLVNLLLLRLLLESLLPRQARVTTSASSNITIKNCQESTRDGPLNRSPPLLNCSGRRRKETERFREEEKEDSELENLSVEEDGSESRDLLLLLRPRNTGDISLLKPKTSGIMNPAELRSITSIKVRLLLSEVPLSPVLRLSLPATDSHTSINHNSAIE